MAHLVKEEVYFLLKIHTSEKVHSFTQSKDLGITADILRLSKN